MPSVTGARHTSRERPGLVHASAAGLDIIEASCIGYAARVARANRSFMHGIVIRSRAPHRLLSGHSRYLVNSDRRGVDVQEVRAQARGTSGAPSRREDRNMLNINIDSERDAMLRYRVVPAPNGGWDVVVQNGRSIVSTTHCADWHRVERVCALMGTWQGTRRRRPARLRP
jgi:hypothetical protein